MERQPVRSSNIKSIGYEVGTGLLEVEFTSGKVYQYPNVAAEEHDRLMKAKSIGAYFAAHIRPKEAILVSSTCEGDARKAVPAIRKDAGAAIPVARSPQPNSWFRTKVAVPMYTACPVCGMNLEEIWQDHHLRQQYTAGWLFGSWMCQSSFDGQDCSRFVFVHEDEHSDKPPCEVVFNCQKTRALRVEEICRQVLASRKALAPKGIENG